MNIKGVLNLVRNMGFRYIWFRSFYEFNRRTGILKHRFPANPPKKERLSLHEWKNNHGQFFFQSKEMLDFPRRPSEDLKNRFLKYKEGEILFFNSLWMNLGRDYDWMTNPDSGYTYNKSDHWTIINDYSKIAGDIKFVWEKSRFSFLYDIIRYDYHFKQDCASVVFAEIRSWINNNPINSGPNFRCSQELSLRVLNWTFALHYYRNAPELTEELFYEVQHSLYWQVHHIYKNINFSRIAVRNNHALTEALTLYIMGLLYPSIAGFEEWSKKGKAWFEKEIAYQIYEDGTFLQFSMNYHRVVIQLLTWGIRLAELNNDRFSEVVYERARRSVKFILVCMNNKNGWLPNYGANDGSLFFKLNDDHFRDYRSQVTALADCLDIDHGIDKEVEDLGWYNLNKRGKIKIETGEGLYSFEEGGYYIIREPQTLTFIRCGKHRDRPSQADNLHIDIWENGENILIDAGSYKYNTTGDDLNYFMGTASHNTIMLEDLNQMRKGSRFIWYNWSQAISAGFYETPTQYCFQGKISAFGQTGRSIYHLRKLVKLKNEPEWVVFDEIQNKAGDEHINQRWHFFDSNSQRLIIEAVDGNSQILTRDVGDGWYSSLYATKHKSRTVTFSTKSDFIKTVIRIKEAEISIRM